MKWKLPVQISLLKFIAEETKTKPSVYSWSFPIKQEGINTVRLGFCPKNLKQSTLRYQIQRKWAWVPLQTWVWIQFFPTNQVSGASPEPARQVDTCLNSEDASWAFKTQPGSHRRDQQNTGGFIPLLPKGNNLGISVLWKQEKEQANTKE